MSDDDRLDYRQMFPIEGRNRKRYAANPRKPKEPKQTYGFFTRPTSDTSKKPIQPIRRDLGKRYDDDSRPLSSMAMQIRTLVAKDLDRSVKSIAAELDAMGYDAAPQTVGAIRQDMMATLRLCQKHGSIIIPAWED